MNHREIQDCLDDYVGGLLSDEEQAQVELHLEGCEDCREEVRSLRSLLAEVALLPRSIAPERDLWAGIADRIGENRVVSVDFNSSDRRAIWLGRGMVAAAAVVLVALSSLITAILIRERPVTVVQGDGRPQTVAALVKVEAFETEYSRAIEELSVVLRERRERLSPETVVVIEENLRIIDAAIQTSRTALEADPHNQRSIHAILAMYRKKIDLLQRAIDLPLGI
jgi:anti-sigma-K factor RskA